MVRSTLLAAVLFTLTLPGAVAADPGADMVAALKQAVADGELMDLHGVLILHDGEVFAEAYFPGEDQSWGKPLGVRDHGPQTLHDMRSVSKPVVGLLYGIALAEGAVRPPEAPLLAQFPDYADLAGDPLRDRVTIADTLAMRIGHEWDETIPYDNPRNSEIQMERADDRYRFVLSRPMIHEPGTEWTYNGGAVALIAKLIEDGVGEPIDTYAERVLFEPLGITNFEWVRGRDGVPAAASGLRLSQRDMAKLGTMVLQNGAYDGRQIVPADWLARSFTPRSELNGLRYGWLWWLAGWGDPPAWAAGFGNGGQRLTIQPEYDLVITVTAGRYNDPESWKLPVRIIEEFMVPALREKLSQ